MITRLRYTSISIINSIDVGKCNATYCDGPIYKSAQLWKKIGPFVGTDYEIGLVVGIGLFEGTSPDVSLTLFTGYLHILVNSRKNGVSMQCVMFRSYYLDTYPIRSTKQTQASIYFALEFFNEGYLILSVL